VRHSQGPLFRRSINPNPKPNPTNPTPNSNPNLRNSGPRNGGLPGWQFGARGISAVLTAVLVTIEVNAKTYH